ncbi:response regulator transcription factor [Panacibacter sp. DH6]|uniref:Response regulator transcription factor n=1 Tax=Panacibacter microcysteis TaxID=2793269 RepID=A0A931GYX2_9BACT|nr:response regulator transcription factor [Panacibacter microcysteis]MBG9377914.1 response regulator transcription factor [Panacibacter microcysteis]
MIGVLIFEDNNDLRNSLSQLITRAEGLHLLGAFPDCMSSEAQVKKLEPDVILMDIDLPGINGIQAVQQIRRFNINVQILMLTVFDTSDKIFDALCAGASGYLLKKTTPAKLIEAISDVHNGGAPMTSEIAKKVLNHFARPVKVEKKYDLSARQKDILFCLTQGYSYKMIAEQLELSIDTVRFYIKQIYLKLQVNSAPEAVSKALREHIV